MTSCISKSFVYLLLPICFKTVVLANVSAPFLQPENMLYTLFIINPADSPALSQFWEGSFVSRTSIFVLNAGMKDAMHETDLSHSL